MGSSYFQQLRALTPLRSRPAMISRGAVREQRLPIYANQFDPRSALADFEARMIGRKLNHVPAHVVADAYRKNAEPGRRSSIFRRGSSPPSSFQKLSSVTASTT